MAKSLFLNRLIPLVLLLVLTGWELHSQEIGVFNASQKKIFKFREGKSIDFRIDYDKLYPDKKGEYLESRVFALVDSISGENFYLTESYIVLNYSKSESVLVEQEYEYTGDFVVNINDVKAVSVSPTMSSVGNALFVVGLATLLASPLLGLSPDGYQSDRLVMGASIGAGTAIIGGALKWSFNQKPVKFKEFDGPEYFKSYQPGSLSVLE